MIGGHVIEPGGCGRSNKRSFFVLDRLPHGSVAPHGTFQFFGDGHRFLTSGLAQCQKVNLGATFVTSSPSANTASAVSRVMQRRRVSRASLRNYP